MANNQVIYRGRKVVVTGAASGMGECVARQAGELGAEVYAMDIKNVKVPVKEYIPLDLGDQASINTAAAALPEEIDHVFSCAGVPGITYMGKGLSPLEVVTINYIGVRCLVEFLIPRLHESSSILLVSSIAAMNWRAQIEKYKEFVNIKDFNEAQDYILLHRELIEGPREINKPYSFAKECLIIYAVLRSWELAEKKIRINTVSPGATQTPMHDDFLEIVGRPRGGAMKVSPVGYESVPDQQASAMLMLNSDMADYVSGQDLQVDFGLAVGAQLGRMKDRVLEQK